MCGVKLPTRLVGRVRGKTTHTQKKGEAKSGGGGRGLKRRRVNREVRKLKEFNIYILYIHAHTHTQRHMSACRHMKIAAVNLPLWKKTLRRLSNPGLLGFLSVFLD